MKTVNLSIPDPVWREARIEAAKHNTTLSGPVRAYLVAVARGKAPVLVARQSSGQVSGYEPSRGITTAGG